MALGASRECWLVTSGPHRFVLKRDPPTETHHPTSRGLEFAAGRAAAEAGVPTAVPIAFEPAGGRFGTAGFLSEFMPGTSSPRRILQLSPEVRGGLLADVGRALARLHDRAHPPPEPGPPGTGWLAASAPGSDSLVGLLDGLEAGVADYGQSASMALAIRRLRAERPEPLGSVLCHGDARVGNFQVENDRLTGLIDWELARRGDRAEDLAFFCLRPWRFGRIEDAGGLGSVDQLLAAYNESSAQKITRRRLHYFSLVANLRWGLYCIAQSQGYLRGEHSSLERLSLGRRVSQVEWDLLDLLEGGAWPRT